MFTISTPLMTMHFQAKHEVAADEWCRAVQLALLRKKRNYFSKILLMLFIVFLNFIIFS